MKIGFFDSGLGGLTILRATKQILPEYDYLYYGDTKHLPYGDKTEKEIYTLTKKATEYLFKHDCLLIVIACNTASSETLRRLQDGFLAEEYPDRRILGVVIPTVEEIIQSGAKRALLIATKRTVESNKYQIELDKKNITDVLLESIAAPDLVPLIERNEMPTASENMYRILERRVGEIDTVVLACTHYTELKNDLRRRYPGIRILSQDEIIPQKLASYLMRHPEIEKRLTRGSTYKINLTKHNAHYQHFVDAWFKGK